MKLPKDEWNQLNKLLGKIGFGGYYDCIEVLRSIAIKLSNKNEDLIEKIREEDDLFVLILVISKLSGRQHK